MTTAIIYPLPFDNWNEFRPYWLRFIASYNKYPPIDANCGLILVRNNRYSSNTYVAVNGFGTTHLPHRFIDYYGDGCDIGSAQFAAHAVNADFLICLTSRCYFHRAGWLQAYLKAREQHGPGLYGASASYEGSDIMVHPNPHICTRGYGIDAQLMRSVPIHVRDRKDGMAFEAGKFNLTRWVHQEGGQTRLVTWVDSYHKPDWRWPDNIFRRGDQSNMLVHDKHSDLWRDASLELRIQLSMRADP